MGKLKRFEETEIWKSARNIVRTIYSISGNRLFGADLALCDQIRRASVSIASNIAE
jgi:four helix bundle protein